MSSSNTIHQWDTLYTTNARGKVQLIAISIVLTDGIPTIRSESSQEGGTIKVNNKLITKGKNIGKKNETTATEQAINEGQSLYNRYIDKGYVTDKKDLVNAHINPLAFKVMRPRKLTECEDKLTYPIYVSTKLDGIRMISYYDRSSDQVIMLSRNHKPHPLLHYIKSELHPFLSANPTMILDGEAYTDPSMSFERLTSILGKTKSPTQADLDAVNQVKYFLFDVFDYSAPDRPFDQRIHIIEQTFKKYKYVTIVEGLIVSNREEMIAFYEKALSNGYEGIVAKLLHAKYRNDSTSQTDAQFKLKPFNDEEFVIVDVVPDKVNGSMVVIDVSDKLCNVRLTGSIELKQEMLTNKHDYIGKKITVRYDCRTEAGQLRFPVGQSIYDPTLKKWVQFIEYNGVREDID